MKRRPIRTTVATKTRTCTVTRTLSSSGFGVEFVIACRGPRAVDGSLTMGRRMWDDGEAKARVAYGIRGRKKVWHVGNVDVDVDRQRQGLATKLYEAAAAYACKNGGVLVSDDRLVDAKSNDFWWKQVQKGRARIVDNGYPDGEFVYKAVVLDCKASADLSGIRRKGKSRRR